MKVHATSTVDAKKTKLSKEDALKLAKQADKLYAMKGTKTVQVDLKKDSPDEATILGYMLGPTGNLRAPTLRVGKTLIVGFDEGTYNKLFENN